MSHSSTGYEIISLDAGLRMDGIPALDLWDVMIEVLHSSINKKSSTHGAAGNRLHMLDKGAAGHSLNMPNTNLTERGNQNADQVLRSRSRSLKRRRPRGSDLDDHEEHKYKDETRIQNQQSRVRLVV